VLSELLLKRGTKCSHLDNAQLYSYGVFFNFVGMLMTESTGSEGYRGSALRMRLGHMINVGHLFQHGSDRHGVFRMEGLGLNPKPSAVWPYFRLRN
jgi:hypothetical protein